MQDQIRVVSNKNHQEQFQEMESLLLKEKVLRLRASLLEENCPKLLFPLLRKNNQLLKNICLKTNIQPTKLKRSSPVSSHLALVQALTQKNATSMLTYSGKLRCVLRLWSNREIWLSTLTMLAIFMPRNAFWRKNANIKTKKIKLESKRKRFSDKSRLQQRKKPSRHKKPLWTRVGLWLSVLANLITKWKRLL